MNTRILYITILCCCVVCIITIICTVLLFYIVDNHDKEKINNEVLPALSVIETDFDSALEPSKNKSGQNELEEVLHTLPVTETYFVSERDSFKNAFGQNESEVFSHILTIRETNFSTQLDSHKNISGQNYSKEMCKELFSTSLKIQCFYEKAKTSCDEPMFHGTIAKLECKNSYHHDSIPYNEILCVNGTWNGHLFNCKPVCGKRATKSTPRAIHGLDVNFGDFPWHIGLYRKKKVRTATKLFYNCGGSIISPKLIITAAHCFLELDPWRYQVAAGKVHRRFAHAMDTHAQYRDVVDIRISSKYDGELNGYTADIAILVLRDVFILSNLIQPICLDFNSRLGDVNLLSYGEVPGWGKTSELGSLSDYLQYLSLPIKNYRQCKENVPADFLSYITFDKICAGYTNGTSVCTGDSGGGLVSKKLIRNNEEIYYLIGIVSTSPFKDDSCDSYRYTTFTNTALHADWINETMYRYEAWTPYDYGCKLPEEPTFGNYTVLTSIPDEINERNLMSRRLVPQYTKLTYFCSEGYEVHGDKIITCKEKRWGVNNLFPMCFRKCSALESSEHEIEYSSDSVDGFLLHETQAFYRCFDSNYELEAPAYNQITCRDGEWTKPLLNCIPICGIVKRPELFTRNEIYAYPGQYPWIVGIYFVIDSNNYLMESSGAIISPFIVITSVYEDFIEEATYLVVAGNTHYEFRNHSTEMIQQSFVYRIMLMTSGIAKRTHSNQYILILKTPLKMTPFVRPICLSPSDPITADVTAVAEMPLWIENDDNLRIVKFKIYRPRMKFTAIVPVNDTTPLPSVFTVSVSNSESGSRYFFMGYGVSQGSVIQLIQNDKSKQISEVAQKYNIKADEMSECTVPYAPSYARLINTIYRSGEIVPETTAIKFNCQLSSYDVYSSKENTCKNSSWTLPDTEPVCVVCGMSGLKNNSQIISPFENYYRPNNKDFPWHVGIYDKDYQVPKLFCSGSIISSKVVLTYFNCFLDYIVNVFDKNKFAIAAGKFYNNWNNPLDTHAQFVDIDNIIYNDQRYRLLVVAILKEHLHITSYVLPVCLDVRGLTLNPVNPSQDIPIWSEEQIDGESLKFLRFSERNQSGDFRFTNSSLPCETYERNIVGSGVVTHVQINDENSDTLRSVVRNFRCPDKNIPVVNLYEHVNWLISVIQDNKD